jgi:hypothetical protein
MNNGKEAMRMAIVAQVMEQELFKHSKEVTITQKYYREKLMLDVARRSTKLIVDALYLIKSGIQPHEATALVFLKENMLDIITNKKCDECPAKDICTDHHCETKKTLSDMDTEELNNFLDNFKPKP